MKTARPSPDTPVATALAPRRRVAITGDPRPAAGQSDWFAASVRPHEPALRAFLSRRFSCLPDHEDIVQETYIRLLRTCDPRRLPHTRALLFTIARNVSIDLVRRMRRTPVDSIDETSERALLDTAPDAAERCDLAQGREAILEALETLPARCREVMFLRYVDGFAANEIAVQLGLAAATVRVQLMHGVRHCTRFFRARGLLDTTGRAEGEHSGCGAI